MTNYRAARKRVTVSVGRSVRIIRELQSETTQRAKRFSEDPMQVVRSRGRRPVAFVLLLALLLVAHGQTGGSATPLEATKVVEAFLGSWDLTGSATDPLSKGRSHLTVTMHCESAALGMAVSCRMASDETGGSHAEMASIIGYSPDDRLVHLMEVSSSGTYHEHKGRWNGNVIQFERMSKSVAGKQIVEDFSIGFPSPRKMTVTSVEEAAEGRSTMELVGTKRSGVK
jgi:hypothetical protein